MLERTSLRRLEDQEFQVRVVFFFRFLGVESVDAPYLCVRGEGKGGGGGGIIENSNSLPAGTVSQAVTIIE